MTEIVPLAETAEQPEEGGLLQMKMNGKPVNSDSDVAPVTFGAVVSPDPRGGQSAFQGGFALIPVDSHDVTGGDYDKARD